MAGHYKNVFWKNNPHVTVAADNPTGQLIKLEYVEGIRAAGRGAKIHFLSWFHNSFEKITGLRVPVTKPKGDIHLCTLERQQAPPGRYWVVVAGGKADMTAKIWSTVFWQQTVDTLAAYGIRCVQAGGTFTHHYHPTLANVESYVGKTQNERNFFALIAGCEGVICGITAAMHIAAVFDKPCVVIAGGREEPWWEHYAGSATFGPACPPVKVPHKFLHTVGLLDCGVGNLVKGCWRDRTVPIEQRDHTDPQRRDRLCKRPVSVENQAVPECLSLITPDHVVEAVMEYFEQGIVPPIGPVTGRYRLPVVPADPPAVPSVIPAPPPNPFPTLPGPARLVPPAAPPVAAWKPDWEKQLPKPVALRVGEDPAFAALDHPYVGGKFTLFVLGFGDDLGLIDRCLTSIIETCPPHRFDLRVALNQPSPRVEAFVAALGKLVTAVYVDRGDRRKYPAMREMFWDARHPVATPYLCWFDDDSWCRKKDWMVLLTQAIVANHPHQCRLYGAKYIHDLAQVKRPGALREAWFHAASWWRGVPLYAANGKRQVPNGSEIVFASGGFWALSTSAMREAGVPDERLVHNGGDILTGAQMTQAGYKVFDFSPRPDKAIIAWSDAKRRGYHEPFPWA